MTQLILKCVYQYVMVLLFNLYKLFTEKRFIGRLLPMESPIKILIPISC